MAIGRDSLIFLAGLVSSESSLRRFMMLDFFFGGGGAACGWTDVGAGTELGLTCGGGDIGIWRFAVAGDRLAVCW